MALTMPLAAAELPVSGIEKFGIVGLLTVAVWVIWREGNKRQDKLEQIIERNTKALTQAAEIDRSTGQILVEVKDAVMRCHDHPAWDDVHERRKVGKE